MLRWVFLASLLLVLVGCRSMVEKLPSPADIIPLDSGSSISLEEYLDTQRQLNERYLYGTPQEALKASEAILDLDLAYAKHGQRKIDSDHAIMLAYARLFVLSEHLRQRPEAEYYLEGALKYALVWKPELGALPEEKRIAFLRSYLNDFEKGLEVNWKESL